MGGGSSAARPPGDAAAEPGGMPAPAAGESHRAPGGSRAAAGAGETAAMTMVGLGLGPTWGIHVSSISAAQKRAERAAGAAAAAGDGAAPAAASGRITFSTFIRAISPPAGRASQTFLATS